MARIEIKKWLDRIYKVGWSFVIIAFLAPIALTVLQLFWNPPSSYTGQDASQVVINHLQGCSTGGESRVSVWSQSLAPEFSTYMEVILTPSEYECLKGRGELVPCSVGCDLSDSIGQQPPEWFKPFGQPLVFKGAGRRELCMWRVEDDHNKFLIRRLSISGCSVPQLTNG
jgi:hypothetical protein